MEIESLDGYRRALRRSSNSYWFTKSKRVKKNLKPYIEYLEKRIVELEKRNAAQS